MRKLVGFLSVGDFMPVFLDDVVHPQVAEDLASFALTAEDEDVVVEANLNKSESRGGGVSFSRGDILPDFLLFVEHHDVVEVFVSFPNRSSSAEDIKALVPSLAGSVIGS